MVAADQEVDNSWVTKVVIASRMERPQERQTSMGNEGAQRPLWWL